MTQAPAALPLPQATFGPAFARFWKKGFTFTGRASRAEFWKAWLATTAVVIVADLVALVLLLVPLYDGVIEWYVGLALLAVSTLFGLATFVPAIAVSIRRLHDTNLSGAAYLVSFIPVVGGAILLVLLAQPARAAGSRFDLDSSSPVALPATPAVPEPVTEVPARALPVEAAPVLPVASVVAPAEFLPPSPAPIAFGGQPALVTPIPGISRIPGVVAAPPTGGWTIELPDGRAVTVEAVVSFGRDPVSDRGGVLLPVDDPGRSMSKTHARFEIVAEGGLVVTDLHSTNGTRLESPSQPPVTPGVAVPVSAGTRVFLGDYEVRVRRG